MPKLDEEARTRVKAYAFDKGYTDAQLTAAWNNALAQKNNVITQLYAQGKNLLCS